MERHDREAASAPAGLVPVGSLILNHITKGREEGRGALLARDSSQTQPGTAHSPETILRFWRAVELLSPQPLKGPRESRRDEPIAVWRPGDLLSWQEGHELRRRRPPRGNGEWRHFVYLGVYDLALAVAELEQHFGRDPEASGETPPGQACLAALMVTTAGRPMVDSYTLSNLAWSLGRTRRPGPASPDWLEGFDDAVEAARESLASRLALDPDNGEGQRIQGLGFRVGPVLAAAALGRDLDDAAQGREIDHAHPRCPAVGIHDALLLSAGGFPMAAHSRFVGGSSRRPFERRSDLRVELACAVAGQYQSW